MAGFRLDRVRKIIKTAIRGVDIQRLDNDSGELTVAIENAARYWGRQFIENIIASVAHGFATRRPTPQLRTANAKPSGGAPSETTRSVCSRTARLPRHADISSDWPRRMRSSAAPVVPDQN